MRGLIYYACRPFGHRMGSRIRKLDHGKQLPPRLSILSGQEKRESRKVPYGYYTVLSPVFLCSCIPLRPVVFHDSCSEILKRVLLFQLSLSLLFALRVTGTLISCLTVGKKRSPTAYVSRLSFRLLSLPVDSSSVRIFSFGEAATSSESIPSSPHSLFKHQQQLLFC